jgi:hypothetical protein
LTLTFRNICNCIGNETIHCTVTDTILRTLYCLDSGNVTWRFLFRGIVLYCTVQFNIQVVYSIVLENCTSATVQHCKSR